MSVYKSSLTFENDAMDFTQKSLALLVTEWLSFLDSEAYMVAARKEDYFRDLGFNQGGYGVLTSC